MGSTRLRRPPAPTDAERARSLAPAAATASLVGTGSPGDAPLVHHVRADGSAVLLSTTTSRVLDARSAARGGRRAARCWSSPTAAPVDLREPVRGLLWIIGWLGCRSPRRRAGWPLQVADVHPHRALLELGHGATLVRLRPGSAVLADGDGSAALTPVELAAARPTRSAASRPLARPPRGRRTPRCSARSPGTCPPAGPLRGARVRPLGVDRCGLRPARGDPTRRPRRAAGVGPRGWRRPPSCGSSSPTG